MADIIKDDATKENSSVNVNSNYKGQRKRRAGDDVLIGTTTTNSVFSPKNQNQRGRSLSIPVLPAQESMSDFRRLRIRSIIHELPEDHALTIPAFLRAEKSTFFKRSRPQIRNRLIQKSGDYNIRLANVEGQRSRYASDLWTTLIEVKWRWSLLACVCCFLISWLFFAIIYYCIIYAHGDLDEHEGENDWHPCLEETKSFLAVFMFSLETQHTIGYGSRHPSDRCPQIVFTIALQSVFGVVIQTLLVGVVFAKLTRPKHRALTLIFSKNAVIASRDGRLCFMFRIGDMRKSNLSNGNLTVLMIRKHVTTEGEVLPYYLHEMSVQVAGVSFCPPCSWPPIVCHTIDKNSPLYDYNSSQLAAAKFEIMVILDGVNSTTGQSCQARTSYLPSEIKWGHRFDRLVTYQRENGEYRIDYNKFHTTYPVHTATCSAREIDDQKMIDLDATTFNHSNTAVKPSERHDCNMWETPHTTPMSTIHKGESPAPETRKITLQALFDVATRKPAAVFL